MAEQQKVIDRMMHLEQKLEDLEALEARVQGLEAMVDLEYNAKHFDMANDVKNDTIFETSNESKSSVHLKFSNIKFLIFIFKQIKNCCFVMSRILNSILFVISGHG